MIDGIELARPNLAIDPIHDGRHELLDIPLDRESIPFCIDLPEESIACFTYTWVNHAGEAGRVKGKFVINGKTIPFDTFVDRHHSWHPLMSSSVWKVQRGQPMMVSMG